MASSSVRSKERVPGRRSLKRVTSILAISLIVASWSVFFTWLIPLAFSLGDYTDLDHIISGGDTSELDDFIDRGGSIHDLYGASTAIELAAMEGDLPMLEALVENGAPIRIDDRRVDILGLFIANVKLDQAAVEVPRLMMLGASPCRAVIRGSEAPSDRLVERWAGTLDNESREVVRRLKLAEKGCVSSSGIGERIRADRYPFAFGSTFLLTAVSLAIYSGPRRSKSLKR